MISDLLDSWINANQLFKLSLTPSMFLFLEHKYLSDMQGPISMHNKGNTTKHAKIMIRLKINVCSIKILHSGEVILIQEQTT